MFLSNVQGAMFILGAGSIPESRVHQTFVKAITEIVLNLIWATRSLVSKILGPQEVWSQRNMGPKKLCPHVKIITWLFLMGSNFLGT